MPEAPCSVQERRAVNAAQGQGQHQSFCGGCIRRRGAGPRSSSFPGLPDRVHSRASVWPHLSSPVWHIVGTLRSAELKFSHRSKSQLRECPLRRCLLRAGCPGPSDPEEGARHPLPRSAVPSPRLRPARGAPQPAGSEPSIDRGRGDRARRSPTPRFSLLIEVCLSRVRRGQRQKPNI